MAVQTGTYWYRTIDKYVPLRMGTYFWLYMTVHGSTWQLPGSRTELGGPIKGSKWRYKIYDYNIGDKYQGFERASESRQ
jgi:hypothetical protein